MQLCLNSDFATNRLRKFHNLTELQFPCLKNRYIIYLVRIEGNVCKVCDTQKAFTKQYFCYYFDLKWVSFFLIYFKKVCNLVLVPRFRFQLCIKIKAHSLKKKNCGKIHKSFPILTGKSIWSAMLQCFPGGSVVKDLPANAGDQVRSLGWEDPLEKEMATPSSILAWEIPWTEEPGPTVHGVAKSQTWLIH